MALVIRNRFYRKIKVKRFIGFENRLFDKENEPKRKGKKEAY